MPSNTNTDRLEDHLHKNLTRLLTQLELIVKLRQVLTLLEQMDEEEEEPTAELYSSKINNGR